MRQTTQEDQSNDTLRILLVDDAQMILDRLVRAVSAIDGTQIVGTCKDGARAISQVAALEPDLVILDISLRNGNGWDVLRHIVANNPRTDVYMFSNDASAAAKERFVQGGAKRFFDKSLDFSLLLAAVKWRVIKHRTLN